MPVSSTCGQGCCGVPGFEETSGPVEEGGVSFNERQRGRPEKVLWPDTLEVTQPIQNNTNACVCAIVV